MFLEKIFKTICKFVLEQLECSCSKNTETYLTRKTLEGLEKWSQDGSKIKIIPTFEYAPDGKLKFIKYN